jgi:cation diffusion facilitator CzcD-associated flavoprotein CzcO
MLGTYEYPDFPMDTKRYGVQPGQFIPGAVLHQYLTDFAKHFSVYEKIQFGRKVNSAKKLPEGAGWELEVLDLDSGISGRLTTAKLVVATGMTSEPFVPLIPGSENFSGSIFHVKEFAQRADTVHNANDVVIIGGTKSAWDAAYAYAVVEAKEGRKVHIVMRESGHGKSNSSAF